MFKSRFSNGCHPHILICGEPGTGCAAIIKKIMLEDISKGVKSIVLDCTGEYKDFTLSCGGKIINYDPKKELDQPFIEKALHSESPVICFNLQMIQKETQNLLVQNVLKWLQVEEG